jgi:hypothetical protein
MVAAAQGRIAEAEAGLRHAAELTGRRLAPKAEQALELLRGLMASGQMLVDPTVAEEEPAAQEPALECRARPARPDGEDAAPASLRAAVGHLSHKEQEVLSGHLYKLMCGDMGERHRNYLLRLAPTLYAAGASARAIDRWLERLLDPDADRRSLFALRFHIQAGLPWLDMTLRALKERERTLPLAMRRALAHLVQPPRGARTGPAP